MSFRDNKTYFNKILNKYLSNVFTSGIVLFSIFNLNLVCSAFAQDNKNQLVLESHFFRKNISSFDLTSKLIAKSKPNIWLLEQIETTNKLLDYNNLILSLNYELSSNIKYKTKAETVIEEIKQKYLQVFPLQLASVKEKVNQLPIRIIIAKENTQNQTPAIRWFKNMVVIFVNEEFFKLSDATQYAIFSREISHLFFSLSEDLIFENDEVIENSDLQKLLQNLQSANDKINFLWITQFDLKIPFYLKKEIQKEVSVNPEIFNNLLKCTESYNHLFQYEHDFIYLNNEASPELWQSSLKESVDYENSFIQCFKKMNLFDYTSYLFHKFEEEFAFLKLKLKKPETLSDFLNNQAQVRKKIRSLLIQLKQEKVWFLSEEDLSDFYSLKIMQTKFSKKETDNAFAELFLQNNPIFPNQINCKSEISFGTYMQKHRPNCWRYNFIKYLLD